MTAGIVYLNGEFMRIEAQTGFSLPQYIQPLSTVNTSRQFEDNTTQVLFEENSATINSSTPASGQYISVLSTTGSNSRQAKPPIIIDIGDWNMDSTDTVNVPHGLSTDYKKIRSISVVIRDDADSVYFTMPTGVSPSNGDNQFFVSNINSSTIDIQRVNSGIFDDTGFNATGFNRGWITIVCEP
jgi:hypothetical protein